MIEKTATIVKVEEEQLWVEIQPVAQCTSCSQGKGCGALTLSKAFGHKVQRFAVAFDGSASVAQQVKLGFSEQRLLLASLLVYVLPLLVLVASVVFAPLVLAPLGLSHEGWQILTSLALTAAVFFHVRRGLTKGWFGRFEVCVLQVLPDSTQQIPMRKPCSG